MRGNIRRVIEIVLSLLLLAACTSGEDGEPAQSTSADSNADTATSSPTGEASPSPAYDLLEGSFNVGDHELYIRCSGTGSPTVVYLHGSIPDPNFSGSSSALAIQDILDENHRMCVYDRANIGLSGSVDGPSTGKSSVRDLHRLLGRASVEPPYVLLAASLGGLIADIYAATYPDQVVGMVQLDSPVSRSLEEVERRFVPERKRIHAGDWKGTNEEIDELTVFAQARALEGDLPAIPMTYLASNEIPSDPNEAAALRKVTRRFVDRFSPGRLIYLDVPHYMEPEIPDLIARETERVIVAAGRSE